MIKLASIQQTSKISLIFQEPAFSVIDKYFLLNLLESHLHLFQSGRLAESDAEESRSSPEVELMVVDSPEATNMVSQRLMVHGIHLYAPLLLSIFKPGDGSTSRTQLLSAKYNDPATYPSVLVVTDSDTIERQVTQLFTFLPRGTLC